MVEITSKEQNKVKRVKDLRIVSETSGTITNVPSFGFIGVQEEEEIKKGYEKNFEEIIVENFPNMKKESQSSPRGIKSPIQDKLKEKHNKIYINQTKKD